MVNGGMRVVPAAGIQALLVTFAEVLAEPESPRGPAAARVCAAGLGGLQSEQAFQEVRGSLPWRVRNTTRGGASPTPRCPCLWEAGCSQGSGTAQRTTLAR